MQDEIKNISNELKNDYNDSLRCMNISNELRNKKMTNDFNKLINNKLEELIEK